MRDVLIYRSDVLPPTQTFILAQAKALRRYTPHFVGLAPASPGQPLDGFTPCLLTPDHSLRSRLRKAAYRVTGFSPKFHTEARKLKGSLMHVHFAEDGPMALPLAVDLQLPMVVTLHGSIEPIADRYLLRTLRHAMYVMRRTQTWKRTSTFICVSNFIYDVAIKAGYPRDKLLVHYIGIDRSSFHDQETEDRDSDLIVFVGRLEEKKGCRFLLSAMALVQQAQPNAKLVIIGDGSQRASLEAQARDLRLSCTFVGSLPPKSVAAYMKRARVFCGPSVRARDGNSEGLGMVFAEAQASGLPVVSFAHGGIPEVVLHGETGLLAPEGNIEQLAACLTQVLGSTYPWHRASKQGIDWIRKIFDLEKQTSLLEDIYDRALLHKG